MQGYREIVRKVETTLKSEKELVLTAELRALTWLQSKVDSPVVFLHCPFLPVRLRLKYQGPVPGRAVKRPQR